MALSRYLRPIVLLVALTALAACGDDAPSASDTSDDSSEDAASTTSLAGDDPDGPYCRNALEWQVHELDPFDPSDPDALHAYFDDWVGSYETAAAEAPPEIADSAATADDALNDLLVPVLERYDYDVARMDAEGTPEEQALFDEPPADVQEAQEALHEYESRVCAAGQPAAADVTFTGAADSPYCEASNAFDADFGEVIDNGAQPEEVEAFMTDEANLERLATAHEIAPDDIAEDEEALDDYVIDVQLPVIASYDYDFGRLLLEASPEERQRFQYTDPAISEQFARVEAYSEQVCGTEGPA
jgi:hypothetical protein